MNIALPDIKGFYIALPCSNPECSHMIEKEVMFGDENPRVDDIELGTWYKNDEIVPYILIEVCCAVCDTWLEREWTEIPDDPGELDQFDVITEVKNQ